MSTTGLSFPVQNDSELLQVAFRASALAQSAGCSPVEASRVLLAALKCGRNSSERGTDLTLDISSSEEGTVLIVASGYCRFEFPLPRRPESPALMLDPGELVNQLAAHEAGREKTLRDAREHVAAVQSEMEDTNRGVLALYAELDDRAEKLKRADELKSRFLSYASHELRTPLNGIVGLIRLLNARSATRDPEEQKQLGFVLSSAEEMREMVNDLLDLAKVEAGKVTIQPSEFGLEFVFGALRGIFRPLLQTDDVSLHFDDTSAVPSIYSDEAKVSQILRNLISNALKFTEHGEVRVWAELEGEMVRISVRDTGIGIAPEHTSRIFEEYAQIEHHLQRRVRGTGLGLPLCRRLSSLLGGHVQVESELGRGSVFSLVLPLKYHQTSGAESNAETPAPQEAVPARPNARVLIIDPADIDRYLTGQLIRTSGAWEVLHAGDGRTGLEIAQRERPDLIVLDLGVTRVDAVTVLTKLHGDPRTDSIPVVAVTDRRIAPEEMPAVRAATATVLSKSKLTEARRLSVQLGPPLSIELFDE